MNLAFGFLAYVGALAALAVAAFVSFQTIAPADRGAITTASGGPPPRSEPKRVEPIRPLNEPSQQTLTPKYEVTGVPLSATAAYNKKKAKEQYGQKSERKSGRWSERRSAHRNGTRTLPPEAQNAYGHAPHHAPWGYAPQSPYAPRDRFGLD